MEGVGAGSPRPNFPPPRPNFPPLPTQAYPSINPLSDAQTLIKLNYI